jgi:hypothetical protein
MRIDPKNTNCTVIVTVDGDSQAISSVTDHASSGLDRFAAFPGYIAGATHLSEDGSRIIQYLQWQSKEAHEACMNDPSWDDDEGSRHFIELMGTGAIKVSVGVFDVIDAN